MTLEGYLADLGDEETPLTHSELLHLSGLSPDEFPTFKSGWPSISQSRKCEILSRLAELAEDNLEMDFTAVFRSCLEDDDAPVRERAALGLEECADRTMIRPLIKLLKDDPTSQVRTASAISLRRFAEMAQSGKFLAKDSARLQEAFLTVINREDEDLDVRRRAIEAVAHFDSPEVHQIIREAHNSGDPRLRQSAVFAMGQSSTQKWLSTVLDEMRHEDPAIRYEAAAAGGQLGDESTVPHLIRLIEDEDPEVQLSAVRALGSVGGPLAKRALLRCLKQEDDALEQAARTALGDIEFDEDPLGLRFQV